VADSLDTLGVIESRKITLRDIFERRFGIYDGRTRTIDQLSKELNLQRESLRRREDQSFRKLRHPSRSAKLALYATLPQGSLGLELWGVNFPYQIQQFHPNLDLAELKTSELYNEDYLAAEFPSMTTEFGRLSHLPLTLLLRQSVRNLPGLLDLRYKIDS